MFFFAVSPSDALTRQPAATRREEKKKKRSCELAKHSAGTQKRKHMRVRQGSREEDKVRQRIPTRARWLATNRTLPRAELVVHHDRPTAEPFNSRPANGSALQCCRLSQRLIMRWFASTPSAITEYRTWSVDTWGCELHPVWNQVQIWHPTQNCQRLPPSYTSAHCF